MKYIELYNGMRAIVDDGDYEKVKGYTWSYSKYSGDNTGYVLTKKNDRGKKAISLHRFILDAPDGVYVDHINGNGLDNRRENLRLCSNQENHFNRRPNRGSTSKYKGVSWSKHTGSWKAQIHINKKQVHLGYFKAEEEAALAYNNKAKEMFGEFAYLNPIGN